MASAVTSLAKISEARRALASAQTLEDVLSIRDQAKALEACMKIVGESLSAVQDAGEVKLRAERKAGEMLAGIENHGGDRRSESRLHVATLNDLGIEKTQSSRWQREAAVDDDTFEQYLTSCRKEQREITQAGLLNIAKGCHVSANSGENEWYTPPEYIEAARDVMGSIDLDPASCETAQANVKAKRFCTIDDDGLVKKWTGNVWLNPPYSKESIGQFAAKLITESARITQAIVLVNNATDTAWFHELASIASAVCFLRGRVKFLDQTGKPANTPVQGQAVLYVGPNVEHFRSRFSTFGLVVVPVRQVLEAGTLYDLWHLKEERHGWLTGNPTTPRKRNAASRRPARSPRSTTAPATTN
jgi:phage N-6-adenine-methyltransferase